MRVLYFSRGDTVHDWRFLSELARSRHEISSLQLVGSTGRHALPEGVRQVRWPYATSVDHCPESLLKLMPAFESVLGDVRPDLVHAGPVQSCGFMTALAGARPFLLMSWGSDVLVDSDRTELLNWVTRFTLGRSDMLLADCSAVVDKTREMVEYAEDRVVRLPWGVDVHRFCPGPDGMGTTEGGGWGDAFVVLSTRSWEPLYDIETLLESFRTAHAVEPRLRLVLLGKGSLASRVEKFIAQHGLDDVVLTPGTVSDERLPGYFRGADLYLSCARSDGTSVSLLEAMATGLPVVVTDAPGNRQWVTPGENGWLAPVGDAATFARQILQAAQMDEKTRAQVGERNRAIVERQADWQANFPRLLEAYDRLEAEHAR